MMNVATGAVDATIAIPVVSATILAMVSHWRLAARLNVFVSLATLADISLLLLSRPASNGLFLVDDLNIVFLLLNGFVGFTTSIFSAGYIAYELETGNLTPRYLRFYHAMYQSMMAGMNLALITNNLGLMWFGIELATLATVMMVGIYRTHAAVEAAWKYLILASVGIALALFGTILVYLAAEPALGAGMGAMQWTNLLHNARLLDPAMLNVAFIFLLIGYGTKAGLVPMHAWLPDAHAEGPTPISAVLSGLLLNVAIYVILRFKVLLAHSSVISEPNVLMIGTGMVTLLFAAIMLYRRRDIKRMFAYSSVEHMGIIAFAFGVGGTLGNVAGLLQMMMHSLTKSAIFFTVGHVAQAKGTQKIADIRGLTSSHPLLGWMLVVGVVAIAGLPPFGIFTSEFLLITSTFAHAPILAVVLGLGILLAFGALIGRMTTLCFGTPSPGSHPVRASKTPILLHFGIVLFGGMALPVFLYDWFAHVALLLG